MPNASLKDMEDKPLIMIVDDDPGVNELIKEYVETSGYRTLCVFDGLQAVQVAGSRCPDLILLDINIPAGGGEKVYSRLKLMRHTTAIPILFVTGESPERIANMVRDKGMSPEDIFAKPIDFGVLLERIKNIFSEK
ncbi:MAG: hypothetical protein COT16_00345 [Elusimicrobia bacterium CG08_land_8_20_14_0_20_44_26]|nr:MAG: hypothetical protein COT16_00345 [Elusimicrobia bacterium CG08_land_8_20_14_0_20_44_26]